MSAAVMGPAPLLFSSNLSHPRDTNQLLGRFIPEAELQGLEAREQSDRLHLLENRIRLVATLQVVVGICGLRWWRWWKPMLPETHCSTRGSL